MKKSGFTYLEVIIVIGIIGILSTVFVTVLNPAQQLAKARDSERETELIGIMSAITQYSSEHSGSLPDTDGDEMVDSFPTALTCIGTDSGCFNLAAAGEEGDTIVPIYMASIPIDPKFGDEGNTGYMIYVDENNRLVASATPEFKDSIVITR